MPDWTYQDHVGLWKNELKAWVPDVLFDAHVHLGPPEAMGPISPERLKLPLSTFTEYPWDAAERMYADLYSGKRIAGLIAFAIPIREVNLEMANAYIAGVMKRAPIVKGFIVSDPRGTPRVIRQFNETAKAGVRFLGVKPYFDFLGKSNYDCTLAELLPRDLLEFMNAERLVMMLHTTGLGMCVPDNQRFIKDAAERFPNIKIILAHMGRYLEVEQFMAFMDSNVMDCPNVCLEVSSASRTEVYERTLARKDLWPRLLFGSDVPFGLITGEEYWSKETGPVFLTRDDYSWSDPALNQRLADIRLRMTYNTYHTIKAMKTAMAGLKLPAAEEARLKRQVFLENAQGLLRA